MYATHWKLRHFIHSRSGAVDRCSEETGTCSGFFIRICTRTCTRTHTHTHTHALHMYTHTHPPPPHTHPHLHAHTLTHTHTYTYNCLSTPFNHVRGRFHHEDASGHLRMPHSAFSNKYRSTIFLFTHPGQEQQRVRQTWGTCSLLPKLQLNTSCAATVVCCSRHSCRCVCVCAYELVCVFLCVCACVCVCICVLMCMHACLCMCGWASGVGCVWEGAGRGRK